MLLRVSKKNSDWTTLPVPLSLAPAQISRALDDPEYAACQVGPRRQSMLEAAEDAFASSSAQGPVFVWVATRDGLARSALQLSPDESGLLASDQPPLPVGLVAYSGVGNRGLPQWSAIWFPISVAESRAALGLAAMSVAAEQD
jgi:hypothetical protein